MAVLSSSIMGRDLDSFSGTRLIDRLQSARHILASNAEPTLCPTSDARSVALAVVHSQDASELVLCALAEHLGIVLGRRDGFEDILKKLLEKAKELGKTSVIKHERFLRDLNEKRIAFKHYGALPDVGQNYEIVVQTSERLNQICKDCCDIALLDVDVSHLIEDESVRIHLQNAKGLQSSGQFREALESLSMAMNRASRRLFPMHIIVGNEDTEDALMLSGYGINPASFLALQKLLPGRSPRVFLWNRRRFGHEGNWTFENVQFAIETCSEVILKLQHARPIAEIEEHRYCFHDVVTVIADQPTVHADDFDEGGFILTSIDATGVFSRGNKIYCWASTAKKLRGKARKIRNIDDLSEWVVAYNPRSAPGTPNIVSNEGILYFRTQEVSLSDEEDETRARYVYRDDAWLDEDAPNA